MKQSGVIQRHAARALIIDRNDRILLFQAFDPAQPDQRYWCTVGGGINPAETPEAAVCREVREETGFTVDVTMLSEPLWRNVSEFSFDGRQYVQHEMFYAVHVDAFNINTSGWEVDEQRSIAGYRWWSLAELTSTDEIVYPTELPELLRSVVC